MSVGQPPQTSSRCPAGVVLAAGQGRRFGGPPGSKLLAPLEGRPLLEHVLLVAARVRDRGLLADVLVVHRPESVQVASLARTHGLRPVPNPEPDLGLASSIRAAIDAIDPSVPALMILVGDQPRVRAEIIDHLVQCWLTRPTEAVRAGYHDTAGQTVPSHPVIVPRHLWPLLHGAAGDVGFGPVLEREGRHLVTIPVTGTNPDVDTPEDLLRL